MHLPLAFLLFASTVISQDHGEEESEEMGPVAFMWPHDREWGASVDNTEPCGSAQGVGDRTPFPIVNGQIALVMQDDAWRVEVGISYLNDPQSNSDFEAIKAPIPDVDPGHMCYPIPNPPADIREGGNGTIQIRYTADFSTDLNETYYACADIHYVLIENFDTQVPCFNVSSDDFSLADEDNEGDDNDEDDSASPAASSAPQSTSGSSESNSPSSGSGSSLSGGAIAGIVIGVVAVLATIGGFFFIWGRRKQQQKHRQQEANVRAVKWTEDSRSSASGSKQEDGDIPLRDM